MGVDVRVCVCEFVVCVVALVGALSLSLSHTHTLTHALSLSLSRTHTHSQTHAHTLSLSVFPPLVCFFLDMLSPSLLVNHSPAHAATFALQIGFCIVYIVFIADNLDEYVVSNGLREDERRRYLVLATLPYFVGERCIIFVDVSDPSVLPDTLFHVQCWCESVLWYGCWS